MGALTPEFLFSFEDNMRQITENEYARLSANVWWSKFMKTMPSSNNKEIVAWLISTAQIETIDKMGGHQFFEDLVTKYTTYENGFAGAGFKLQRRQMEDNDGGGFDFAAKWSGDIGAQMAYWPQKQLVKLMKEGHLTTASAGLAYDGKAFFAADHLVNPANAAAGTFANLFTGAASGVQPGALPIDDSVSVDVALTNLSKAIASIKSIKMANGVDPRYLRPTCIVAPPRMQQRVAQLTNAKFIAQAATGGAGSADVEAFISSMGLVQPVIADEFAGFENDTTWFLATEEMSSSQLGAFLYIDRKPFQVTYYTGNGAGTGVDAVLDRADELEWHVKGRNGIGYGHPYSFFKIKAT